MYAKQPDYYRCEECGFVGELPPSRRQPVVGAAAELCCSRCGGGLADPDVRVDLNPIAFRPGQWTPLTTRA